MLETRHQNHGLGELVGQSPAMQMVFSRLRKAAACDVPVILYGPCGSGKHLAARTLHQMSLRKNAPFIPVSTSGNPDRVQSRLFGEPKDADQATRGLVAEARGGTLYVDELAHLNHAHQVALLRILEDDLFNPAIRLVSATRHDPEALLASGCIREDFHYRTHVVPIRMPPLCERLGDLPLLAGALCQRMGLRPLSRDELQIICSQPLVGNVTGLASIIQHIVTTAPESEAPSFSLKEAMGSFERAVILRTLQKARGDLSRTASLLGVHRKTLAHKIQVHGISPEPGPPSDPS